MKALRFISIIALMALGSCSANRQMAKEDTYYSPYGNMGGQLTKSNGSYVSPSISSNSEYDYQAYYSDSKNYVNNADPVYQTTETVTDTNGVVYTTTETYYDADYAARIKRFGTQASSSRDYYDDYYTYGGGDGNTYVYVNSYDPYYWYNYPSVYVGGGYRPYWSSYWSWNYYWGYSFYYSYWGWSPYWYYDWGYHNHYWHHPHHYHGDWHHNGGHHNGGFGGGGNGFSNYVASLRHGHSTGGSMSHAFPNNGRKDITNSSSMLNRPKSSVSSALARAGSGSSSMRRPTMSNRPSVGSSTPQHPIKRDHASAGSQNSERQNYTSPNSRRPSRSSSEYVRPQNPSSSRPSSTDSSRRSSNSGSFNRSNNSSSSNSSYNRSSSSPSRSSSSSSSRSSGSSYSGGSRGSSSSSSSHSSSSSSHSFGGGGSRGSSGGGRR